MTPQLSALIALKTFKMAKRFRFLLALSALKVTQADKHKRLPTKFYSED